MACGGNLSIFRKFDRMAYLSTLHRQSQLLAIEREIDEMDALDNALINLAGEAQRYFGLKGTDVEEYRKSNRASPVPSDNIDELFDTLSVAAPKYDDRITAVDSRRMVEVVFKLYDDVLTPYIVLRGPWQRKVKKDSEAYSISVFFSSSDQEDMPFIMKHEASEPKRYSAAASWAFIGEDIRGGGPFQPRYFIGEKFKERVANWPVNGGTTLSRCKAATLRLIIWYDAVDRKESLDVPSAVAILSGLNPYMNKSRTQVAHKSQLSNNNGHNNTPEGPILSITRLHYISKGASEYRIKLQPIGN
ncbi:hypothetical protein NX059_010765 [Plenodomus lindquistii]|nr:hypothetical protein NX059_010765 [Plenodomus lindquistii]